MGQVIFNATTKGGDLKVFRSKDFRKEVVQAFPEKDLLIKVERKKKKRSIQQNSYYWGVVIKLMTQFFKGEGIVKNEDETHQILTYKFLKVVCAITDDGEVVERVKSTTELSTVEFEEYILNIRVWVSDFFNVDIPEPNEQREMFV